MEELLTKIKDLMVNKGVTVAEFPTYEWDPKGSEPDCGNGEYLYQYRENYDQTEFWNTYIRRVKLVDGELLFDLQEVYEDTHDNYDELDWYLDQKLEETELTEPVLKNIIGSIVADLFLSE